MHDRTDPLRWERRYVEGDLPWETGEPDALLAAALKSHQVAAGRALEIGCGTGVNAVWLAERGFDVTGVDLSPTAIGRAVQRSRDAGVDVCFLATDFLATDVPGAPFAFACDRGCFHVFDEDAERARFAQRVAAHLAPGGLWHSVLGSTDGPPREVGPPRRSAAQIAAAIEPYFEIVELRATRFGTTDESAPHAWTLVARRR